MQLQIEALLKMGQSPSPRPQTNNQWLRSFAPGKAIQPLANTPSPKPAQMPPPAQRTSPPRPGPPPISPIRPQLIDPRSQVRPPINSRIAPPYHPDHPNHPPTHNMRPMPTAAHPRHQPNRQLPPSSLVPPSVPLAAPPIPVQPRPAQKTRPNVAVIRPVQPKQTADLSFQSLNKYLRLAYVFLGILVFFIGGWAYFSKIEGAVLASGKIAVEGKPKVLQHLEGGIVSEIVVSDGDFVQAGNPVLYLDSTILDANKIAAETNYYENEALVSRLQAERSGQNFIAWTSPLRSDVGNPRLKLAKQGQQQIFDARRAALTGQVNQLQDRINKLRMEDQGLVSEIRFTRSELSIVSSELQKYQSLLQQGLISRSRVIDLERDMTRLENQALKLETRRQSLFGSMRAQDSEIAQLQRVRREDILTQLRAAQIKADTFAESLKTVSNKTEHIQIKAPVSGTVHNMVVTTIGGVISPGQEIMQIIPNQEKLLVTGNVQPKDIDQVTLGQTATVVFSTLNQKTAPELSGRVSKISADALVNDMTGSPYYAVEIEIPDDQIPNLNGQELLAGMPASIFIQTKPRTVLNYILAPMSDALGKTMRDD